MAARTYCLKVDIVDCISQDSSLLSELTSDGRRLTRQEARHKLCNLLLKGERFIPLCDTPCPMFNEETGQCEGRLSEADAAKGDG